METVTRTFSAADGNPGLAAAAACISRGAVAIIPTETVYGLAAHPLRPDAVSRMKLLKGRDFDKPLQLLISDISTVWRFAGQAHPGATRLMHSLWPGPLTIVLPSPAGPVGLRIPEHEQALKLISLCGGALWATSANLSGMPETASFHSALRLFKGRAGVALDGGPCMKRTASTVVSFSGSKPVILRAGAIPKSEILRIAGNHV